MTSKQTKGPELHLSSQRLISQCKQKRAAGLGRLQGPGTVGQGETGGLPLEERLEQGFCVLAKAGGRQATAVVYASFLMTLLSGKCP